MHLFLIRHAPAVAWQPSEPDAARPLSERGRARFARAVERLRAQDLLLDALLTSPWRRAAETAELLRPLVAGPVETTELLAGPPGPALLEVLAARDAGEGPALGLVGHQPWLGELLALLALGDEGAAAALRLGKGSVCHLEGAPGPGGMRLRSLQTLRDLRA